MVNEDSRRQQVCIQVYVHFVKARGQTHPKTFKLKTVELAPHQAITVRKIISLATMTTRRHYVGPHRVEIVLNGQKSALGMFQLNE